jgi:plastocyanin
MRSKSLFCSFYLAALLGPGCSSNTSTTSDAAPTTGGDAAAFTAIAPCASTSDYVTGMTAITTLVTLRYSPQCLKVTAGTRVSIQATSAHPLAGLATGSANNPIPAGPNTADQMVTFATAGFYPYKCNIHGGIGMTGVVWVQ